MGLALPFILSSSIWTLQIALDRILLSRSSSEAVGAAMAAALLFWTPISLLQNISGYASTFVAQYTGAGQPRRVGPAVWQALYFSVVAGLAFLALLSLARPLVALGGHTGSLQELEAAYFRCLCFSALPTLITASCNSFFSGRGDSWTVFYVDAAGLSVNGLCCYALIFGNWGFPALGIVGAGWATVVGTSTSATLALGLMLRPRYRKAYGTASGWRFDGDLFRRLLRFGVPNGLLAAFDGLAFTAFLFLVGRQGEVELAATSIAFTLNIVAFLPMLGIGQAVSVLVGQRLGENRPALAARSTWTGLGVAATYMSSIALLFVLMPNTLVRPF
jgi:MATE family multidrug resistance protein